MQKRTVLGFALAPALLPLGALLVALAQKWALEDSLTIAAIYAAFTYSAAVVLGTPAYLLFRRTGWRRWWQYALAGIAIGLAFLLLLRIVDSRGVVDLPALIFFTAGGAASTTLFWIVTRGPREPTKSTSPR